MQSPPNPVKVAENPQKPEQKPESLRARARRLGISRWAAKRQMEGIAPGRTPEDRVQDEKDRQDRIRLLNQEREALRAVAGEKSFREFLEQMTAKVAPRLLAPPKYRPLKIQGHHSVETLLLFLSDWHGYEVVSLDRTLGLNSYDGATMGRRVRKVVEKTVNIKTRLERSGGWRFPRLAIACDGDFVSGTIHEVERHTDAPNVLLAALGVGDLLAQAIRQLAAHFETVEVFCTAGNHGRLPDARRVQSKDPRRSWDTLIYVHAMTALQSVKNVKFYIPDSWSVIYELEGHRFYQGHGHDIQSWMGIPFYGISRKVSCLNSIRGATGQPIKYFLFGHFHNYASQYKSGCEYIVNGSLIGGTEFGLEKYGDSDPPVQWLLGVHKEHGISHRWPLLAKAPDSAPGYTVRPWTTWN